MAEFAWRITLIAAIGGREHRAANPWLISLTTTWPRALLQCLFFTMIGRVVGGDDGQAFTFVGSVAVIITIFALAKLGEVPTRDRWYATFYRLRSSPLPVPIIYAVRCWPVLAEALVVTAVCILLVGLSTGQASLAAQLLKLLPLYALLVVTSSATGLALAAIGLAGRAGTDVTANNVCAYLIIAASGALIPSGQVRLLDAIGTALPMRHGLLAIRNQLANEPWLGDLLAEASVGAAWAIIAVAAYAIVARRARSTGHDKVT